MYVFTNSFCLPCLVCGTAGHCSSYQAGVNSVFIGDYFLQWIDTHHSRPVNVQLGQLKLRWD